jgi:hypothetical protein
VSHKKLPFVKRPFNFNTISEKKEDKNFIALSSKPKFLKSILAHPEGMSSNLCL